VRRATKCLVLLLSFFNFLLAFRNGDLKPSDKREKLITHSGNVDHVEEETKKKNLLGKRLL
jgi:hypothetical protein